MCVCVCVCVGLRVHVRACACVCALVFVCARTCHNKRTRVPEPPPPYCRYMRNVQSPRAPHPVPMVIPHLSRPVPPTQVHFHVHPGGGDGRSGSRRTAIQGPSQRKLARCFDFDLRANFSHSGNGGKTIKWTPFGNFRAAGMR